MIKQVLACALAEVFATAGRSREALPGLRVLAYHAVGTSLDARLDPLSIYSMDPRLFERHVAHLAQSSFCSVVDFSGVVYPAEGLHVAITFDDGYRDNLYAAGPVLKKYRMPFTVFVTTSFVESGSPIYMNRKELRDLAMFPGATIGSHGVSHAPMAECTARRLREELVGSKRFLEDVTGKPVTCLSYPHGSANRMVRDAAAEAGYSHGGCLYFPVNRSGRDPLLLGRSIIKSCDTERVFHQKLHGDWDWYGWIKKDPARP